MKTEPATTTAAITASRPELPLFRDAVVARQQSQWFGTVLLAPRVSHSVFAGFAAAAVLAVILFLALGAYTRKAHLNGWLAPDQGVLRLFAPHTGIVTRLAAHEGDQVSKGARLATVSSELSSAALGPMREEVIRTLRVRRDNLAVEQQRQRQLFVQRRADLADRIASKTAEQNHLDQEIQLQRARHELASANAVRQQQLLARQLAVEPRVQQAEEDKLDQAIKLQSLVRAREGVVQDRLGLDAQMRELPLKEQDELGQTERSLAALDQQLAEAEAQREVAVTAPQDGIVASVQAEVGSTVGTTTPLMTILPNGSELSAQLFGTSRAIGFIRPGQRVLLRYAAFPYQKFGSYEGTVATVARSALSPADLPPRLSGLTSLYHANEPIYEITVRLKSQSAMAYGTAAKLQPGMQVEADVMLETRRLIEWVLDPLYTLAGKSPG